MTIPSLIEEQRNAILSPCRTYRYLLTRRWSDADTTCAFILLNPSTADENLDDPTIRRCIGFAKTLGYGGLIVANLFALRSTDPAALLKHPDPVGPDNDEWLRRIAQFDKVICGWGVGGKLYNRGQQVAKLLREAGAKPMALKVGSQGFPSHPLYLRRDLQPIELTI